MAVAVVSTESVRRIHVTGDPSAAGSIPTMVGEGDIIAADDTGKSYIIGSSGRATVSGNTVGKSIAFGNRWVSY